MRNLKVAIVHEWFVDYSGSEKVVEQLLNIYPEATLFSVIDYMPDHLRRHLHHKKVNTTFIQKLPFAKKQYRNYLVLMPLAIEQLNVSEFDLVISSSHAVAKGVLTHANQVHVCYCHSPIRYAWDLYHQYIHEAGLNKGVKGFLAKLILHYIRNWDYTTANRVDYFVANSNYIARRIHKVYNKKATVIYPPVDVTGFELVDEKEDFYVTVSRMVPYKKIDIIVEAFRGMPDKKLIIIGDGPDFNKIKSKATRNVTLMGYQPFDVLKSHMQRAKAFIFAAEEDFGITPVEAQACGTPVIAFARGGAVETVIDGITGILFHEQTATALLDALRQFEEGGLIFNAHTIRENASRFSTDVFKKTIASFIETKLQYSTANSYASEH
ncbi:glycosyltransferase family 4 protein [Pontibacter sp. HJ8]